MSAGKRDSGQIEHRLGYQRSFPAVFFYRGGDATAKPAERLFSCESRPATHETRGHFKLLNFLRRLLSNIRLEVLGLVVLGLAALATGIHEAPLVDWDEATYAEVVHEAVSGASYLNFTWNGQAYMKKPPVLFWAMAVSYKALGESEFAARLPSVLMGAGTLVMLYLMTADICGRLGGLFAGLIPLGFYFFIARGGRECATDAPLVFFSTIAIFALGRSGRDRRWIAVIGVACGLAILSKGLAGVIPLVVACASVMLLPSLSSIGVTGAGIIMGIAAAIAGPWFLYEMVTNGWAFWSTFVKQETVMRVVKHLENDPPVAGFTMRAFGNEIQYLWPLVLPLLGLLIVARRRGFVRTAGQLPYQVWVWMLWLVLALAAATAVQTKLGWYVLPALIPVAPLAASILAAAMNQEGSFRRFCLPLAAVGLALLAIGAPARWTLIQTGFAMQRGRSWASYQMAVRARELADSRGGIGDLYFAGVPLPTVVYYSGLRCHFVSPSQPEFELIDSEGNPMSLRFHDLVFRDGSGVAVIVDNLDEEWLSATPES
jgi:4-amino-4-deoxy-L-arabinose transferase-like glycosyltransferase